MPSGRPAVSICIPTYNYAHYLPDAVRSACGQTYREVEVLVIDDGSTDDTMEVLAWLASQDKRIRCLSNERNLGLQGNFNRCLQLASHDYVKVLCADDMLAPTCVEKMVRIMESRPEVTLVACAREFVDSSLRPRGVAAYSARAELLPGDTVVKRCFFRGNLIGEPSAVMFRKSRLDAGFDEAYKQVIDMEFWFRLLEGGWFAFIPEPLCRFRQHGGRATFRHIDTGMIAADRVRLFRQFAGKHYMAPALHDKLLWDLRMAWLLGRESATAGNYVSTGATEAVFYPKLLYPLIQAARLAAALGAVPRNS